MRRTRAARCRHALLTEHVLDGHFGDGREPGAGRVALVGSGARRLLLRQICLLVCELTIKGGWAGVNIAPASEAPERARRAPDARRGYGG